MKIKKFVIFADKSLKTNMLKIKNVFFKIIVAFHTRETGN